MTADVVITSFGYGHGKPPDADLVMDLRRTLRDPLHTDLRDHTGREDIIVGYVLSHPGALLTVRALIAAVEAWRAMAGGTVRLAVGCGGGRHRSVVVADRVAALLTSLGMTVLVEHRDVDQPVLPAQGVA